MVDLIRILLEIIEQRVDRAALIAKHHSSPQYLLDEIEDLERQALEVAARLEAENGIHT